MKNYIRILSISAIALIIGFILVSLFGSKKIIPDCGYHIPEGYTMVQDIITKEYGIIEHHGFGDEYLSTLPSGEIWTAFPDISKPLSFKDSCSLKAVLKKYYQIHHPKLNFVPVK